ncbi:hypothetical protein GCM10022420_045310 [Streptomyces iranensis]
MPGEGAWRAAVGWGPLLGGEPEGPLPGPGLSRPLAGWGPEALLPNGRVAEWPGEGLGAVAERRCLRGRCQAWAAVRPGVCQAGAAARPGPLSGRGSARPGA